MSRLLKLSANTAASCVSYGVSVGVFFLQFLDWWHATHSHSPSLTALPTPPPPISTPVSNEYVIAGHCPLCGKQLVNSTALTVSGFVFCYPCIHQYVRDNKSCPVTGYPSNLDHLVKIFHQDI